MRMMFLLATLAGFLFIAGCGATAVPSGPQGESPSVTKPSETAKEPASANTKPDVAEPPKSVPPKSEPPKNEPPKSQPKSSIRWYSPGIGYPLVSDDPEAKGRKVALLTLDDGPSEAYTGRVLDTLKELDVKAMFFITGAGRQHRALLDRIHREGHALGVHSLTHANLSKLSMAEMRGEIEPLIALIEEVTGAKPKYLRPPFGAYSSELLSLLKEYGLELLNWSNGSLDWDGVDANGYKDPGKVVQDVMRQLHPGSVILMHDTLRHTAEALPEMIRQIRAEGYEFILLQ